MILQQTLLPGTEMMLMDEWVMLLVDKESTLEGAQYNDIYAMRKRPLGVCIRKKHSLRR